MQNSRIPVRMWGKWRALALAGILMLSLMPLFTACGGEEEELTPAQQLARQYEGYEAYTSCITFTYGPTPAGNRQRVVEMYPDGTASLTDTLVRDENGQPLEGDPLVYKQHEFLIPMWAYDVLEEALFDDGFFEMDENLGYNDESKGYDVIAAQYNGEWHSVGAAGWPQNMRAILTAYRQVLENAYLEGEEEPEQVEYNYTDVTITRAAMYVEDGVLRVYQTKLWGDGTKEYTFAASRTLTREDDPISLLPGMQNTYTETSYIDPGEFAKLVQIIEALDFFSQPETMTHGEARQLPEDDAFYTQRYTVTIGEESHSVTFPPEYYFSDLEWYSQIYNAFSAVSDAEVEHRTAIEEILAW